VQLTVIPKGTMQRTLEGLSRVKVSDAGRECLLDPLTRVVWELCDGAHTVETLATATGNELRRPVTREEIFAALDFLADAGLVGERVAPPVAEIDLSRRALLARFAPAVSVIASMAIRPPWASAGYDQESNSKEGSSKASHQEELTKEGNRKASAQEDNTKEGNRKASDESHSKEDSSKDDRRREDRTKANTNSAEQADGGSAKSSSEESSVKSEVSRLDPNTQRELLAHLSSPRIFEIVGHNISEFPEIADAWRRARALVLRDHVLTPLNYEELYGLTAEGFGPLLRADPRAKGRFKQAGFLFPPNATTPVLIGTPMKSQNTTRLTLQQLVDPTGDDWRHALDVDHLEIVFADPEKAYKYIVAHLYE
jgi:hypothetical protein